MLFLSEFKESSWIIGIGFLAQCMFFSRFVVQLIRSEKVKSVVNPSMFWKISLVGASFMMTYGILRMDIVIICGQFLNYYIYIRNLVLKNKFNHRFYVYISCCVPFVIIGMFANIDTKYVLTTIFNTQKEVLSLLIWGAVGQLTFNSRFIYQWVYSERKKESVLPLGFWLLSIVGSSILVVYAIYRRDVVLLCGQSLGMFVYARNIYFDLSQQKNKI